MNRRQFCLSLATTLTARGLATEPISRSGKANFHLAVAAYSFREHFQWMKGKEQKPGGWQIKDFLDWCADHQVPGAELTSYFFPPDADEAYCREIRRHAWLRGVTITGTAIGNNWALPPGEARDKEIAVCKKWIDLSVPLGAPHIRVFAGSPAKGLSKEEAMKHCIAAYQECLDYTSTKGVFLGIENHHGLVAEPAGLLEIMQGVKSPWAGVNWDSGNFYTADPYADLAKIAPYAVNVQLKLSIKPAGTPTGQPADLARMVGILREANYQGWVALEFEEKADPFTAVPETLTKLRKLLR
jgi:sugar phosphate isomerase/epimerase